VQRQFNCTGTGHVPGPGTYCFQLQAINASFYLHQYNIMYYGVGVVFNGCLVSS